MKRKILVTGNPVDGFQFIGPFDDSAEASAHAELQRHDYWWLADLQSPPEDQEIDSEIVGGLFV